ncbi:MAG: hypothetical protein WA080_03715 [Sulfuricurvum sp.]
MEPTDPLFYEHKLDNTKEVLVNCQHTKDVKSCFECSELIGCPIRAHYVRSVYESMSKGATGGFDF